MSAGLTHLRVILARPRGFCAGVVRAIDIVERALALYGPPVYVRHEIVRNNHVVDRLRGLGAVFVDDVAEIPQGAVTVFSAHGVSRTVEQEAEARNLDVIDATCPLVRKVHKEGRRYAERGSEVIIVGHPGHAEIETNRLRELGETAGVRSRLIEGPPAFDPDWLDGVDTMGLTAGASAPETIVQDVLGTLRTFRAVRIEELPGNEEIVSFHLPERLGDGVRLSA